MVYICFSLLDTRSERKRKLDQDASRFKTDEDTGKIIIDEDASDKDGQLSTDLAGTAYRESITSVDGFTRGLNGRVKFNKNTKKRRQEVDTPEDIDMADGESVPLAPQKKKVKDESRIGHEFKAKVS